MRQYWLENSLWNQKTSFHFRIFPWSAAVPTAVLCRRQNCYKPRYPFGDGVRVRSGVLFERPPLRRDGQDLCFYSFDVCGLPLRKLFAIPDPCGGETELSEQARAMQVNIKANFED